MTAVAAPPRERPILFSGPMVRAILEGRKTQTRRVINHPQNPLPAHSLLGFGYWPNSQPGVATLCGPDYPDGDEDNVRSPYGVPGDRLWVRESFAGPDHIGDGDQGVVGFGIEYKADGAFRAHGDCGCDGPCSGVLIAHPWKPSIHMPRWASRITLEITDVRVERLQEISEADTEAEGVRCAQCNDNNWREVGGESVQCAYPKCGDGVALYRDLWDSLNASRGYGWDVNPWVWVLAFRRVA